MYNGGFLMARLCYFEMARHRPETLEDKRTVLHAVNLHPTDGRDCA
jgi:hypothetical protein